MSKNYKVTVTGNVTAEINGNENKINTLDNSINKNKYIIIIFRNINFA